MTLKPLWILAAAAWVAGCAALPEAATAPVEVKILAINDFHGNLKPPLGGIRVNDPAHPGTTINVAAGGAEHMATLVGTLRAKNPNHVFVAAGDLIGATPLLSAPFRDEPTIESLNLMGLEITAVGNHEFDRGATELLRMQNGGCHPGDGCMGPWACQGAKFQYLAASTVDERSGQTLLPAYRVKSFQGIPVAFIGLTLQGTPGIVVPAGAAGLKFMDEAETVNALVPRLRTQGIEAIVVLIHEGGVPAGDYNECPGVSGPIVDIVRKLDKAVDLVVSGHTHRAYNCRIDGRLVTGGDKFGTIVTEIDLVLDPRTRDVLSAKADNRIVTSERLAKDPAQTTLIETYEKLAATSSPADGGAQLALMNPGGVRAPLAAGELRYEDLFAAQPFYNNLVTMTLSGAQIVQVLEQQWGPNQNRVLQVSRGFGYTWDGRLPIGQRVVPGSARLDGRPLDPAADYRVTVNAFLAGGGDGFGALAQGRDRRTGMMDVDALELYIARNASIQPGPLDRIQRLN